MASVHPLWHHQFRSSELASSMAPAYLPHCGEDLSGTLPTCSPPWRKELVELGHMSSSGLCLLFPILLQASRFSRMPRFLPEPAQTCSKVNEWTMLSSAPECGHQGSSLCGGNTQVSDVQPGWPHRGLRGSLVGMKTEAD